jgi:RNA polymerase sigma-70 factor (ECF subfamily)
VVSTLTTRAILSSVEPAETNDRALLARCATGEQTALAILYDRHCSAAFGLARRVIRNDGLAEDAVQEAFLGVWRGAGRFDAARGNVATWILSLVHHKAVDLVRREAARRSDPSGSVPEMAGDADLVADALASFERTRIGQALTLLTPAQRDVITLAYFDGLTQSELALRLGEPLGTIKSRTHTALGRLREILQEGR